MTVVGLVCKVSPLTSVVQQVAYPSLFGYNKLGAPRAADTWKWSYSARNYDSLCTAVPLPRAVATCDKISASCLLSYPVISLSHRFRKTTIRKVTCSWCLGRKSSTPLYLYAASWVTYWPRARNSTDSRGGSSLQISHRYPMRLAFVATRTAVPSTPMHPPHSLIPPPKCRNLAVVRNGLLHCKFYQQIRRFKLDLADRPTVGRENT